MNPQTWRSACVRAGTEIYKTGHALPNYFRDFSISPSLTESNDGRSTAGNTTARQRSRAAASEINSLANRSRSSAAAAAAAPGRSAHLETPPSASQPQVINVSKLLRGLGGRGTLRLRGRGQGAKGAAGTARNPFSRAGPGPGSAAAGRGSAIRGGRGRKRGTGRRRSDRDDDKDGDAAGKKKDGSEAMDPYEEQFDRDMRFGTATSYSPSLTLESLADFAPAMPTGAAGRRAIALQNLSVLGTADPVGAPQDLQAGSFAADLETSGVRFFADSRSREAAEAHLQGAKQEQEQQGQEAVIDGAEESVRRVIVEQAVRGEHEKMTFATGPVGVSRAWHLRGETWTKKDLERFEQKLTSLVVGGAGAKKKAAAAAAAASS